MEKQNFSNHRKFYPLHHFVFYPIALGLLIWAIWGMFNNPHHHFVWAAIAIATILLMLISLMMRQHYALGLQDRLIRIELRFRYYVLTNQRLEPYESSLTIKQLAALRFASDEELPALVKRAAAENLSSKEIKKSIREWVPDSHRV